MTYNENLRLIEEHGKLKRRVEKLEDTIHSILRAIAQEIPTEEGLSRKLINSPKEDAEALIKDLQEVWTLLLRCRTQRLSTYLCAKCDAHHSASIEKAEKATMFFGLVQALHVYIEHCEHHVSFPLKSALFSVRSELADTQASLWTMQHKLAKQIEGAEEKCLKSAHSAVDQSFCDVNKDIEEMKKEV